MRVLENVMKRYLIPIVIAASMPITMVLADKSRVGYEITSAEFDEVILYDADGMRQALIDGGVVIGAVSEAEPGPTSTP